jgi:hypothetical protein
MFEWFSNMSGLGLMSLGGSLFNSYAQLRARHEERAERLWSAQQLLRFDQAQLKEASKEYNELASYHVDQLRQQQLHNRQQLAYNILNSGMGIGTNDTAGLMLRFQGYQDEMAARAQEAEYIHRRPKSSLNKEALLHGMDKAKAAAPFETISTAVSGVADIAKVFRTEGKL